MSTFIRFHRFQNLNNVKNIVYFDVLNHCILNFFKNVTLVVFLELFGQEHKWVKTRN
jgi:hypothetical protein